MSSRAATYRVIQGKHFSSVSSSVKWRQYIHLSGMHRGCNERTYL